MSEAPERPDRPLLPPAFWALVIVIAGVRCALSAAPPPGALASAAAALVALGGLCALVLRARGPAAAALSLVTAGSLGCALLVSSVELARQREVVETLSTSAVSAWELRVETDMTLGASGWRGRASLVAGGRALGSVWVTADEPARAGDSLRCVGRFSPNADDEWGASSRMQGLAGTVRVVRVLATRPSQGPLGLVGSLRERVLGSLDAPASDGRALVAGSVCGSTSAMSERGLDDLFAVCGVSHLVAVSGGHLVLVAGALSALLGRTRLGPVGRAALMLSLTLLFVVFCGAPASAVRAWVMSLASELARLARRRSHPLSAASAAGLVMALSEPGVTGQLGFLLSVASVCGICVLGGYASYALRVLLPRPRRGRMGERLARARSSALDALSLTLVSQVVTAPLTCSTFGRLSLVAPLANVVLAPLFSALLSLGLAAAALVWVPPAQGVALWACEAVGAVLVTILRALARLPLACVPVSMDETGALLVLAATLVTLLVWWPRVSRRHVLAAGAVLGACALAWIARWRLLAPAAVRVLDVGQGDAILVTDGASSVLVDTGPDDAVLAALSRSHVTHLDAVVLTHLHEDHTGGLEDVLATVGAERVWVAEGVEPPVGPGVPTGELRHGDVLRAGRFSLEVVSPPGPVTGEGNADSIELLVTFRDGGRQLTALLAGDAERDETDAAISRGDVGDVDLLKVGHHGSAASVSAEGARALDAELSVASAGEGNAYGHPAPACREVLEATGSLFLCTMDVGDVCAEPGEGGIVVTCSREPP